MLHYMINVCSHDESKAREMVDGCQGDSLSLSLALFVCVCVCMCVCVWVCVCVCSAAQPLSSVPRLQDVVVMEVEVKGSTEPYHILLEPYAILVPGENYIHTTIRRRFTLIIPSHTHTHTRTHARTHARTHTHTHTNTHTHTKQTN